MAVLRLRRSQLARWLLACGALPGFLGLSSELLFVGPSCSRASVLRAGPARPSLVSRRSKEEAQEESLWQSLNEEPEQWIDGRELKRKGRLPPDVPDFTQLSTGQGLWIESAPAWYSDKQPSSSSKKAPRFSAAPQSKASWKPVNPDWELLFEKPEEWRDFRRLKEKGVVNPKYPDFKHQNWKKSLWINGAPEQIKAKFQAGPLPAWSEGRPASGTRDNSQPHLWSSVLEEPEMWLDYRGLKTLGEVSPKYPDLKHKSSGEGLWLRSAPEAITEKLRDGTSAPWPMAPSRAERVEASRPLWDSLMEHPELWQDCRQFKASGVSPQYPDFKHSGSGEGLWLQTAPPKIAARILNGDVPVWPQMETEWIGQSSVQLESAWRSLFEEPEMWVDYRVSKKQGAVKPRHPDFKNKDIQVALWLGKANPSWVAEELAAQPALWDLAPPPRDSEPLWRSLFEDVGGWVDCRADKESGACSQRHPDFKQEPDMGDAALWIDSKDTPDWVHSKLAEG